MTASRLGWLKWTVGLTALVVALLLGVHATQAQSPSVIQPQAAGCASTYIVQRGDYLVRIAQKELGDPRAYWSIFTATNKAAKTDRSFARLYNPNIIRTGQKLCIPVSTKTSPPGGAAAQATAPAQGATGAAPVAPQGQATTPATPGAVATPATPPGQAPAATSPVGPTPTAEAPVTVATPATPPAQATGQATVPAAQGTVPAALPGQATAPAAAGTAPVVAPGQVTAPAAAGTASVVAPGQPTTPAQGGTPAATPGQAATPAQGGTPAAPQGQATAPAAAGTTAAAQGATPAAGQTPAPSTGATGQMPTGSGKVTGTVTFRERIMPPADAVLVVQLLDVARADAPATVIAEEKIRLGENAPPYPFEITYDPAKLDPRGRFVVAATISYDGKVQFRNTQQVPVITNGPTSDVEIVVQKIG